MAKIRYYLRDPVTNATVFSTEIDSAFLENQAEGKQYRIELSQSGYKAQYIGNFINKGTEKTTPITTCPTGQHWDAVLGKCVVDVTPTPTGVLWDSNIHGKWNNGVAREMTGHHEFDKYDPLTEVAAGDNRRWYVSGQGWCELSGARARVYNHTKQNQDPNTLYEYLVKYIPNSSLDNMSLELFSRHNEDDPPENRFGGNIFSFHKDQIEFDEEYWHNERDSSDSKKLSAPIENGKETTLKITGNKVVTSSNVGFTYDVYVNGKLEWQKSHVSNHYAAAAKQALYWRWRTNGSDPKNVRVLQSRISKLT